MLAESQTSITRVLAHKPTAARKKTGQLTYHNGRSRKAEVKKVGIEFDRGRK